MSTEPLHIAQVFGIEDDSKKYIKLMQNAEAANAVWELRTLLASNQAFEVDGVFERFAALYLPRLFEACEHGIKIYGRPETLLLYWPWLSLLSRTQASGSFGRYIRLHQEASKRFVRALVDSLAEIGFEKSDLVGPEALPLGINLFCDTAVLIVKCTRYLLFERWPSPGTVAPSAFTKTILDPDQSHRYNALAQFVNSLAYIGHNKAGQPVKTLSKSETSISELSLHMVILFKGYSDELTFERDMAAIQWWHCEARHVPGVGLNGHEDEAGPSTMLACSRCYTVRYCGKAHQKLHWKAHKKVCTPPAWWGTE